MCATPVKKKFCNVLTSYQRAHYYENEYKIRVLPTRDKLKSRPDLFYYDPIVNQKQSIYQSSFSSKKKKNFERYGQVNFITKPAPKNLYDDFEKNNVKELKYKETITGSDFKNPSHSIEAELQAKFCTGCSAEEIKSTFDDQNKTLFFTYPYISTSRYYFRDHCNERRNGIAKDDIITYRNGRAKNTYSRECKKKFYDNAPKFVMTVPFFGDTSVYQRDYRCPKFFESEDCVNQEYLKEKDLVQEKK